MNKHFLTYHSVSGGVSYVNNKYGTTYEYGQLRKVLTDTKIYGHYRGNDFYCTGYIDKPTYDKIQSILRGNVKKRKTNRTYLFSGLLSCPYCGRNLTGVSSSNRITKRPSGKVYKYTNIIYQYRCNKAKKSKLCTFTKYLNEERLEKALLNNLNRYVNNHITHVKITANTNTHTEGVKNSIANIQSEMNRLNIMFRKGRVKEEEYDREYEALEKQLVE